MPSGSKPGEHRGGRKKGTPNVKTAILRDAMATMEREGCDPITFLCRVVNGKVKRCGPDQRIRAAERLVRLGWPDRKAVELSGIGGGPIEHNVSDARERLFGLLDRQSQRSSETRSAESDHDGGGGKAAV